MSLDLALAVFYRSLASMVSAGVPIGRALDLLSLQSEHEGLAAAASWCGRDLREGRRLSAAMARHGRYFGSVAVAMVRLGEETGALHHILPRLAESQEKGCALKRRLLSAMAYPAVVLAICLLAFLALPGMVLQPLLGSLSTLGVEMSWPTRVLLGLYKAQSSPLVWLLGLSGLAAAVPATRRLLADAEVRLRLSDALLRVPMLGRALRMAAAVEVSRGLALLLETGVPLLKAVELLAASSANPSLSEALTRAAHGLRQGASMGELLMSERCLPRLVGQMLILGADTGKTSDLLRSVAQLCEESLEHDLAMLEAAAKPLVLAFLGLLAGFLIAATMSPVMQAARLI